MPTLTELPFGLPGRVYRSPMPFSSYDPRQEILDDYLRQEVHVVVVLAEDGEMLARTGRDLRAEYLAHDLQVIYSPVPDFRAPDDGQIASTLDEAYAAAQAGQNLAIHCHAGIGRTGVFAACLARRVFGIDGTQAIAWVRQYIPGAVENREQQAYVLSFC
jgi:protein-tyrosine phosphatase